MPHFWDFKQGAVGDCIVQGMVEDCTGYNANT